MTATAAPTHSAPPSVPAATRPWVSYIHLLRWTLGSVGIILPFTVVIQVIFALGIIIGFSFFAPSMTDEIVRSMSSGAPIILLFIIGLAVVPMGVAEAKNNGSFAYQRSLPVARPVLLAADVTVWTVAALPGIPAALICARLRYDVDFSFDVSLFIVASLLTAFTASMLGYALALVTPPSLTQMITQVLVVFVMLFSPLTYPSSRLPDWLRTLHEYLPFEPAANLIRAGLFSADYTMGVRDIVVLSNWSTISLVIALWVVIRRR